MPWPVLAHGCAFLRVEACASFFDAILQTDTAQNFTQYDVCVKTLNERYSSLSARRRYEVWFVRLGLADGDGAWWFRYLLMNPARCGCPDDPRGMPVQVWATWFPRDDKPRSFIQGFPLDDLDVSATGQNPFYFRIGFQRNRGVFLPGKLGTGRTCARLGSGVSFHVSRDSEP